MASLDNMSVGVEEATKEEPDKGDVFLANLLCRGGATRLTDTSDLTYDQPGSDSPKESRRPLQPPSTQELEIIEYRNRTKTEDDSKSREESPYLSVPPRIDQVESLYDGDAPKITRICTDREVIKLSRKGLHIKQLRNFLLPETIAVLDLDSTDDDYWQPWSELLKSSLFAIADRDGNFFTYTFLNKIFGQTRACGNCGGYSTSWICAKDKSLELFVVESGIVGRMNIYCVACEKLEPITSCDDPEEIPSDPRLRITLEQTRGDFYKKITHHEILHDLMELLQIAAIQQTVVKKEKHLELAEFLLNNARKVCEQWCKLEYRDLRIKKYLQFREEVLLMTFNPSYSPNCTREYKEMYEMMANSFRQNRDHIHTILQAIKDSLIDSPTRSHCMFWVAIALMNAENYYNFKARYDPRSCMRIDEGEYWALHDRYIGLDAPLGVKKIPVVFVLFELPRFHHYSEYLEKKCGKRTKVYLTDNEKYELARADKEASKRGFMRPKKSGSIITPQKHLDFLMQQEELVKMTRTKEFADSIRQKQAKAEDSKKKKTKKRSTKSANDVKMSESKDKKTSESKDKRASGSQDKKTSESKDKRTSGSQDKKANDSQEKKSSESQEKKTPEPGASIPADKKPVIIEELMRVAEKCHISVEDKETRDLVIATGLKFVEEKQAEEKKKDIERRVNEQRMKDELAAVFVKGKETGDDTEVKDGARYQPNKTPMNLKIPGLWGKTSLEIAPAPSNGSFRVIEELEAEDLKCGNDGAKDKKPFDDNASPKSNAAEETPANVVEDPPIFLIDHLSKDPLSEPEVKSKVLPSAENEDPPPVAFQEYSSVKRISKVKKILLDQAHKTLSYLMQTGEYSKIDHYMSNVYENYWDDIIDSIDMAICQKCDIVKEDLAEEDRMTVQDYRKVITEELAKDAERRKNKKVRILKPELDPSSPMAMFSLPNGSVQGLPDMSQRFPSSSLLCAQVGTDVLRSQGYKVETDSVMVTVVADHKGVIHQIIDGLDSQEEMQKYVEKHFKVPKNSITEGEGYMTVPTKSNPSGIVGWPYAKGEPVKFTGNPKKAKKKAKKLAKLAAPKPRKLAGKSVTIGDHTYSPDDVKALTDGTHHLLKTQPEVDETIDPMDVEALKAAHPLLKHVEITEVSPSGDEDFQEVLENIMTPIPLEGVDPNAPRQVVPGFPLGQGVNPDIASLLRQADATRLAKVSQERKTKSPSVEKKSNRSLEAKPPVEPKETPQKSEPFGSQQTGSPLEPTKPTPPTQIKESFKEKESEFKSVQTKDVVKTKPLEDVRKKEVKKKSETNVDQSASPRQQMRMLDAMGVPYRLDNVKVTHPLEEGATEPKVSVLSKLTLLPFDKPKEEVVITDPRQMKAQRRKAKLRQMYAARSAKETPQSPLVDSSKDRRSSASGTSSKDHATPTGGGEASVSGGIDDIDEDFDIRDSSSSSHNRVTARDRFKMCANCDEVIVDRIQLCAGCKKVAYCNYRCQKANWKVHKKNCSYAQKKDPKDSTG